MVGRERSLRTLHLAAELLDGLLIARRVEALLSLEDLEKVLDDAVVKVLAAQVRVARSREHLEDAIVNREEDTSKVPPPRSKTRIFFSPDFSFKPYAIAAAVGSLMMRMTLRPAIVPASLVAWRWASLK